MVVFFSYLAQPLKPLKSSILIFLKLHAAIVCHLGRLLQSLPVSKEITLQWR